ncbi:hypothetical protein GX51_02491 [Blastomyces parvus]|uniref:Rhodopsin domain-containing protein n=1 Tax=Blastomyces parvus TaxID=2060905 RepID=A0A2B7X3R7_9EURO|nr:hypothetical protein GX51_02491 [Blastomyces parvus]
MTLIEPGSNQSLQIGCYVIFIVAMVVVSLRYYARLFLVREMGVDDYLMFGAVLSAIGITVTVPGMYLHGIGRRAADLSMHEILYGRKWAWVSQILYYAGLGFAKSSMVALYVRLASNATHLRYLYAFGTVVFLHGIAATLTTIFICTPISIMWSPTFPVGCIDILRFNYFNAAFHILTDILLAVLPIPILKTLHINRRRKIGLTFCFGVGMLTILVTIARQVTNAIALNNPLEFSWHWSAAELCTALEVNMCIICASVPAMRSLIKVHFGGSSSGGAGGRSYELNDRHASAGTPGGSGAWRKAQPDFNRLESADNKTHIFSKSSSSRQSSSEAIILPQQREQLEQEQQQLPKMQDGVLRSTEFKITYQKR